MLLYFFLNLKCWLVFISPQRCNSPGHLDAAAGFSASGLCPRSPPRHWESCKATSVPVWALLVKWAENIVWEDEPRLQGSCSRSIIQLDMKVRRLPKEATGSWFTAPCLCSQATGTTKKCWNEVGGVRRSDCRTVPPQQVVHPFAPIGNDATRRWRQHGKVASVNNWCNIPQNHFWFHPAQPLVIHYMGTICRLEVRHQQGGHQLEGQMLGSQMRAAGSRLKLDTNSFLNRLRFISSHYRLFTTEVDFKCIWEAIWSAAMYSELHIVPSDITNHRP